jgi:hypothetical protein
VCFVNAIHLMDNMAYIDDGACRGCGRCVSVCPKNAIEAVIDDENFVTNTIRRLENAVDVT